MGIDIDVFLLDRMPETLYLDVVLATAFTIHADLDSKPAQSRFPFGTGVLISLIRVDDLRRSMSCDTFFDKRNAVAGRERITKLPADNITAIDINDYIEIHKAVEHGDIGYICTPDLIAVRDV